MIKPSVPFFSFCACFLFSTGCSQPLCDVNPDDTRCSALAGDMGPTTPTVSVMPQRMDIKAGGSLQILISDLVAGESMLKILLNQPFSGYMYPLDIKSLNIQNGQVTANLTPSILNIFKAGPVDVVVTRANKPDLSGRFRLYLLPSYVSNPFSGFQNLTNVPHWIGIWDGLLGRHAASPSVYTLNDYGNGLNIHQFKWDSTNNFTALGTGVFSTNMEGNYKSQTTLGISGASLYIPLLNAVDNSSFLLGCPLPMGTCSTAISKIGSGSISSISADRDDTTIAISFNGKLQSYYRNTLAGGSLMPVDIDNTQNATQVTWVGVGDIDGDGMPDVVASHQGMDISVFIRTAANKLQYDQDKSTAIKMALGFPSMPTVTAIGIGDADGDGLSDILLARSGIINLFINQGNGQMQSIYLHQIMAMNPIVDGVSLGDFTGDGIVDMSVSISNLSELLGAVNQAKY